jgi:hypothetical protein
MADDTNVKAQTAAPIEAAAAVAATADKAAETPSVKA